MIDKVFKKLEAMKDISTVVNKQMKNPVIHLSNVVSHDICRSLHSRIPLNVRNLKTHPITRQIQDRCSQHSNQSSPFPGGSMQNVQSPIKNAA